MFTFEFDLYLGDLGTRTAKVTGTVTDSFGSRTARVLSVKLDFLGNRTLEARDLTDKGASFEIEEALLEHYQKILDRHAGQPEDWPRDNDLEGA